MSEPLCDGCCVYFEVQFGRDAGEMELVPEDHHITYPMDTKVPETNTRAKKSLLEVETAYVFRYLDEHMIITY